MTVNNLQIIDTINNTSKIVQVTQISCLYLFAPMTAISTYQYMHTYLGYISLYAYMMTTCRYIRVTRI